MKPQQTIVAIETFSQVSTILYIHQWKSFPALNISTGVLSVSKYCRISFFTTISNFLSGTEPHYVIEKDRRCFRCKKQGKVIFEL